MAIVVQTVRTYALDGSTKDFIVPFEYLARKFVQVSLLGTAGRKQLVLNSEFRFSTKNQVTLLQAWGPANGYDRVELRRHTSSTERLVDFTDGSILRATDLNISQIQAIHIAEEARDAALLALPQDDDGNLDAKNRRIVNLAPGINAKDAVNKQQLDETLGEAGGVLSDVKDVQEEIYDYIEKFADDTSTVRGVAWVYNNGSANGGEKVIRIDKPTKVFAVPFIEVNGSRQEVGYHFEFDGASQTLTLAKPLESGDFLVATTTESSVPLEDLLSRPTGASSIGKAGGGNVQDFITSTESRMEGINNSMATMSGKVDAYAYLEDYGDVSTPRGASEALLRALSSGKPLLFTRQYTVEMRTHKVPSGSSILGVGASSGLKAVGGTSNGVNLLEIGGSGCLLSDFRLEMDASGRGSVGDIACIGVHLLSTSSGNTLRGLRIVGKSEGSPMGFTHGVRCTGSFNEVLQSNIQYCSMGITYRGTGHKISDNYLNNHFVDEFFQKWDSTSMFWDGITGEGASYCLISNNVCEYNGQSGIYLGGNNSLSHNVVFSNNTCRNNYNRGIDTGVSGTPSATNGVMEITYQGNTLVDNRETNLWLYGVSDGILTANFSKETDRYDSLFPGLASTTRAGIALGGQNMSNCEIVGNNVKVRGTTPYSVVLNGSGHTLKANRISGGASKYVFANDRQRLVDNMIDSYRGTFKPSVIGNSAVSVKQSSGSYEISDNKLRFEIQMTLSATNASGSLTIGYLPGMSTAPVFMQNVSVTLLGGWDAGLQDKSVYVKEGTSRDLLNVVAFSNGSQSLEVARYISSNSMIRISGVITATSNLGL